MGEGEGMRWRVEGWEGVLLIKIQVGMGEIIKDVGKSDIDKNSSGEG